VQANRGSCTMSRRLVMTGATLVLMGLGPSGGYPLGVPALAAEAYRPVAQAPTPPGAETDKPSGRTSITRGMGMEAVRTAWGEPEQIRRIRTCFGWQEEWVYRGDPNRFGGSERVLLFDEGEVLTEIK
jgi:hypothetical protein